MAARQLHVCLRLLSSPESSCMVSPPPLVAAGRRCSSGDSEAMPHSRLRGVSAEAVANELRAASASPTTTQSRAAARHCRTNAQGRATKTNAGVLSIGGAAMAHRR